MHSKCKTFAYSPHDTHLNPHSERHSVKECLVECSETSQTISRYGKHDINGLLSWECQTQSHNEDTLMHTCTEMLRNQICLDLVNKSICYTIRMQDLQTQSKTLLFIFTKRMFAQKQQQKNSQRKVEKMVEKQTLLTLQVVMRRSKKKKKNEKKKSVL